MPFFGDLIRASISAATSLGPEVIVGVGRGVDLDQFGEQPAGVRLEPWVDQAEVIPRCRAVICHAGAGTTLGALSVGVPIVGGPALRRPTPIAERIGATGCGRRLGARAGPRGPDHRRAATARRRVARRRARSCATASPGTPTSSPRRAHRARGRLRRDRWTTEPETLRFYGELAEWWPLISPPDDYAEEAAYTRSLLVSAERPVHEVLELGSGGGHNAVHLKTSFAMTLVDLSPAMLEMSRQLNAECEHIQGDMRTLRLDRTFDAVFIHDAIEYMTTEDDLRAAMRTAFAHCRPGGVAVLMPDTTTDRWVDTTEEDGSDGDDGRSVRLLSWEWDPDPTDTAIRTDYAFMLREADGTVRVVHEAHVTGLFPTELWLRLLGEVGFQPEVVIEETTEDRAPREVFVARRPAR